MPDDAGAGASVPAGATPSSTRPRWKRRRAVAIVVILVAVLVVLALVFTGVLVVLPQSSPGPGEPQPFSTAVSAADNVSASTSGGPWTLHGVQGSDVTVHFGIQVGSNCGFTSGNGFDSIQPYTGNYSNGTLANWLFFYQNPKATQFLAVADDGGHTSNIGISGSSGCGLNNNTPPVNPSVVVDSTQVAATLLHNLQVERFIASNPVANSSFLLLYKGEIGGWMWQVGYQTCQVGNYGPLGAVGDSLQAFVNATTGTVDEIYSALGVGSCSGAPTQTYPVGTVLGFGLATLSTCLTGYTYAANGCHAGDWTYLVPLVVAQQVVTYGSITFQVEGPNGAVVTLAGQTGGFAAFAFLNGTELLAESPASSLLSMTAWTYPSGSSASNSAHFDDSVLIDMGSENPEGSGYMFVVTGQGSLYGTFTIGLP